MSSLCSPRRNVVSWFPAFLLLGISIPGLSASGSQEVLLNEVETPDRTTAYYIDDTTNTGEVSGGPMGVVCPIDDKPDASIAVGDIAAPNVPGRVRKFILLFHLPAMPDKKLTGAVLRLRLGHFENGTKEKPLPPASLVHAGNWPDASWDSEFHGLDASSFSDRANFAEQAYICDASAKHDFITVDVTRMIQGDYARNPEPVAAFRIEVPDEFDITDEFSNAYHFFGPTKRVDYAPTLELDFD
ncbi:MAG: hypothetical protein D4R65_02990 [Verrucomicrobiaceae bacterium]|nr:MAG: hypothetical protein D4R65_02990 [Verrucomicrobiaceae bacterium]